MLFSISWFLPSGCATGEATLHLAEFDYDESERINYGVIIDPLFVEPAN
jgi:hypothetical protein